MRLKVKHGNKSTVIEVIDDCTIKELIDEIKNQLNVDGGFNILIGFPPRQIDLSRGTSMISEQSINNGDLIILKEFQSAEAKNIINVDSLFQEQLNSDSKVMIKCDIPSDNSCLFTSIHFCLNNGQIDGYDSKFDREMIAANVLANPQMYTAAFLDNKTPEEYGAWIKQKDSWGGAIEVALLSRCFCVEICVVDIQNSRIERFGEGNLECTHRIIILYDGVHYDCLGLENLSTGDKEYKFPTTDDTVLVRSKELANQLQRNGLFTDTTKFKLKCIQCGARLTGSESAVTHNRETGHIKFDEFRG